MSALRSAGRELSCLGVGQASVRSCLLMLLVACVLPATLVAAVLIVDAYHEGRANAFERGTVSSRAIMGEVDDMLVAATAGLQALATSPSLAAGDLAGFHAQALRALPAQAGNNIVLSDLAGQQLLNTLVPFGAPLPRHGNPALQRAVVATGQPAVSDLFTGGVTRRPLVAMEVPVLVDGRVSYTLATGVFPERFAAALSRSRQRPEWVVVLFDRTGTVVSRTHLPERYVGQKGAPALVAAMAQAEQGVVETPTLEGTPVLAAFSRSSKTGWTVAVGIPEQTLLARVQRWVAWLAASTVGVLLLGLVLASFIARRVAGAFAALVPSAEALGRASACSRFSCR
ncbi:MAG: cache domain-containing protein [Pseudomonadota bacterium]